MKHIASTVLLIGFMVTAIFGLFAMDFVMGHEDGGCIASRMNGDEDVCPMGALEMALYHIDAFHSFTLAVVAQVFAFAALFLFIFFIRSAFFRKIILFHPLFFRSRRRRKERSYFQNIKITRWLALFEHSPSKV